MSTRISRRWPWWAELLLVGGVTFLSLQEAYVVSGGNFTDPSVVALVAGGALALRRRWPVPAAVVTAAAAAGEGMVLPLLVMIFHLASRGRVAAGAACAVAGLAGNAVLEPLLDLWAVRSYGPALLLVLALTLGLWADSRRRLVEALAGQVEHERVERGLRVEAARLSERAAIAAEMHDVLAHRLSLIALHTGVLQTRGGQLPGPLAERIALLRTASTDALTDLREVLGALRSPDTGNAGNAGNAEDAARLSAPALRGIDELTEQARAAGEHVDAQVTGVAEDAPATHRLAVFRLVQESLTNARKHAPGAPVRVRIHYGPPATTVEVVNDAAERAPVHQVASGYGLIGLAERVASLGGRLDTGPAGAGSWRVAAHIPAAPASVPAAEKNRQPAYHEKSTTT